MRGLSGAVPPSRGEGIGGAAVAAVQRVVFAGLVPLAGPGAPVTALAREMVELNYEDLVRAIERRGAETLGWSLRGAPAAVVARAAAALGQRLAAVLLDAARADASADDAVRERARRVVAAAGVAASGEAALGVGIHATADALADEGAAALQAVAQRLSPELGRRLLAAADGNG